ncbi:hypothetical protein HD597_010683 [Nonomuraea thailandensis]|uniref:Allene oxide cyclase barrel-like domain-containing protein n=1 Tax=Nonomuraea thailandensis TaxID=1188745 RepID=A0A9X2GZ84_9ACTN|nr:hypothetical protein [Nonomuraea thailandensis]MCP2363663.1 hypothetical protein [Nonomuraea thailandensis]
MRTPRLITALALATGLAAAGALTAGPATAMAANCRVELYDIDNLNVAERDGKDELRFLVGGNLFPNGYVNMRNGDDADPADFGNPSTVVSSAGSVSFNLREVTPPAIGSGDSLGSISVSGSSVCAPLATNGVAYVEDIIDGTHETFYSYLVELRVTGL